MQYEQERNELARVCRHCSEIGLQSGNGGNVSVRVGDNLMLIKASNTSFYNSEAEEFVLVDFDGKPMEEGKKASRECLLHGYLYKKDATTKAIVHCHSPWATGWAATGEQMPIATYHSVMKLKGQIPVLDSESYAVPPSFFPVIGETLDANPGVQAFIMKGHGQFAIGDSLEAALMNAELVEETAKIAVIGKVISE